MAKVALRSVNLAHYSLYGIITSPQIFCNYIYMLGSYIIHCTLSFTCLTGGINGGSKRPFILYNKDVIRNELVIENMADHSKTRQMSAFINTAGKVFIWYT